ncbi:MAG: rRNA maturation RNase YbeY [Pyrinomonadaceae bacterium]
MIEVVNRQRRHPIDIEVWREFAGKALQKIGVEDKDATIAFVSDRAMRELNKEFRGRNATTDVLSFPAGQFEIEALADDNNLGDVVVSLERAAAQAAAHELEFESEIAQLVLHGLLHLCGYDHETDTGEMNRLELKLRRRLSI